MLYVAEITSRGETPSAGTVLVSAASAEEAEQIAASAAPAGADVDVNVAPYDPAVHASRVLAPVEAAAAGDGSDRKVVVVTGGGNGIGAGIVRRLVADGWYVVIVDRDQAAADALSAELPSGTTEARSVDVMDRDAVHAFMDDLASRRGRIDAVVNCAMRIQNSSILEMDEAHLDGMFGIAVKALYWTTQAALPHLERVGGSVVTFSSPAATSAGPGASSYAVVKGAVSSFTWQAARELGPLGVRVNGIIPGAVPTPGASKFVSAEGYEARRMAAGLRRLGEPADIAAGVAFLVSDDASYVNGHLLAVDGGL